MLITIGLGFIPVVGRVLTDTPGLLLFVQGGITVRVISLTFLNDVVSSLGPKADVYPGIGADAAFVVVSTPFMLGFTTGVGCLLGRSRASGEHRGVIGAMIGSVAGVVPGMLMVCIYCSYITLTIDRLAERATM